MPHDMFGDVVARPPAVRSRRSLVVFSICLHAGILVGAIVLSIVAPDVLPFPRQALAFYEQSTNVKLVDIDLPTPRRLAPITADPGTAPTSAAPVVAPDGIRVETGAESLPMPEPGDVPGAVDAIGIGTVVETSAPPPPPPPQPAPVRLSSGIKPPQKIGGLPPVYPTIAREAHVEGIVILEATIDTAGQVQNVRVLRSLPLLDVAAVDAVRQWRYEPAQLNGQPIAVIMSVTVLFQLR